jgi:hypothetical protein
VIEFTAGMTALLVWGIGAHLVADWLMQNEWIALNKMKRRRRWLDGRKLLEYNEVAGGGQITDTSVDGPWWDRHPSLYVHGFCHALVQILVFPWPVAVAIGIVHMFIDTKEPVVGWSRLIHQTTPERTPVPPQYLSIGQAVTIAADQTWHVLVIAIAAFLLG